MLLAASGAFILFSSSGSTSKNEIVYIAETKTETQKIAPTLQQVELQTAALADAGILNDIGGAIKNRHR